MKKVLILISDKNYLEHAKSLFANARLDGKWDGDLCLIANNVEDKDLVDFKKFGVEIIHKSTNYIYLNNFFIYDEYIKKWDYAIYMDCDFMIFDDLSKILSDEIKNKPILTVDKEPFYIHEYFCQNWNQEDKNKALKNYLQEYDLNKYGFNAGFIAFNTSIIEPNTTKKLFELADKLKPINNQLNPENENHISDQPIQNIYFINNLNYVENKKVSYWRELKQNTIAAHFCRWDAPWRNHEFSQSYNKKYIEKYKDNLNYFNDVVNKP